MWNNKEVKKRARKAFKANYWMLVSLCFVLVFMGVISGVGSNIFNETKSDQTTITESTNDSSATVDDAEQSEETGLTKYLGAVIAGKDKAAKVGQELMNSFAGTGGNAFKVFYAIDKFIVANDWAAKALIIVGVLFFLVFFFLFRNVIYVGYLRVLEESRAYTKTKFLRVFYVFKMKAFWNVVKVMFLRELLLTAMAVVGLLPGLIGAFLVNLNQSLLWLLLGAILSIVILAFTIRKYYQLYMIPFVLAINVEAKWKESLTLSKTMTEGNKLHIFGFELSFMGWVLLSALTLGILDIFYVRPYVYQSCTEVFMVLREQALANDMPYAYLMKDDYLTCPEPENIEGDINADHGMFEQVYPERDPQKMNKLQQYITDLNPKRDYSLINLIMLFFSFAIAGWLWECMLYLVQHHEWINRGALYGPWLPIYGFGGVLIIVLLRRFSDKPVKLALLSLLLCGVLEYFTSLYLEVVKGKQWWNYSTYFLNINGRVCFEGLLVFVIAGMAAVYLVGPLLDNIYKKVDTKKKIAIASVLLVFYIGDSIYAHYHPHTGRGITEKLPSQTYQEEFFLEKPEETTTTQWVEVG